MKEQRGIYDHLADHEKNMSWQQKSSPLIVLAHKDNAIDNLFVTFYLKSGYHLPPQKIMNWWVIGRHQQKRVSGRIKDIYLSRDLLVKDKQGNKHVIPFEHVVYCRPNAQ